VHSCTDPERWGPFRDLSASLVDRQIVGRQALQIWGPVRRFITANEWAAQGSTTQAAGERTTGCVVQAKSALRVRIDPDWLRAEEACLPPD